MKHKHYYLRSAAVVGLVGVFAFTTTQSGHPEIRHLLDSDGGTLPVEPISPAGQSGGTGSVTLTPETLNLGLSSGAPVVKSVAG